MAEHKTDMSQREDLMLDEMFAASRAHDPVPTADMMARILEDAAQAQAGFTAPAPVLDRHESMFLRLLASFGGWGGASALTASICVGVFVGITAPDTVMAYVPGVDTTTTETGFLDLFTDTDLAEES